MVYKVWIRQCLPVGILTPLCQHEKKSILTLASTRISYAKENFLRPVATLVKARLVSGKYNDVYVVKYTLNGALIVCEVVRVRFRS